MCVSLRESMSIISAGSLLTWYLISKYGFYRDYIIGTIIDATPTLEYVQRISPLRQRCEISII